MNEVLILMAGLPGSGKTTRMHQMCQDGWLIFDDYKKGGPNLEFRSSPRFRELVDALRGNRKCVVADIHFCMTDSRDEAESILRTEVPGAVLGWHFFENDCSNCEINIKGRQGRDHQNELKNLCELSASYHIPQGAVVFRVWRNPNRPESAN